MTTKEYRMMESAWIRKIAAMVMVAGLSILASTAMLIHAVLEENLPWWGSIAWLLVFLAVIGGGIIGCQRILKEKKATVEAMLSEDLYVDRYVSKFPRAIESLAVDRFDGNLTQALIFATNSAEVSREERWLFDSELTRLERIYVSGKRDMALKGSTAEARREELTKERIEEDLHRASMKYRWRPFHYQVVRAACTGQFFDNEFESLRFGHEGIYHCNGKIYQMTKIGDWFYLVKEEGRYGILVAYAEKDWKITDSTLHISNDTEQVAGGVKRV